MIEVTDYQFIEVVTVTDIHFGFADGWVDWIYMGLYSTRSVSRPVTVIIHFTESYWESIVRP